MMDLVSHSISDVEKQQLTHPAVAGVILFSRNYCDRLQLCELVKSLRAIKSDMLIAVDHEGGRVQRFREGFTLIPAMGDLLPASGHDINLACSWAQDLGFVMAIELLACDIDLSFSPVLDVNGISQVIGTRSFASDPVLVTKLAKAWIQGMHDAGMASVGKHFPGHGSVLADSHVELPVDEREFECIQTLDMSPFVSLIEDNSLDGVMPAHVVYSKLDKHSAGFSSFWLKEILREKLGFTGVVVSDDLGMQGAAFVGDHRQRVNAALEAGCDLLLLCNDPTGLASVLTDDFQRPSVETKSFKRLKPDIKQVAIALEQQNRWEKGKQLANELTNIE